jgi:glycosyltransferase involved in cell wall biosynthesis
LYLRKIFLVITCSLCISTYNWPAALSGCLHTVLQQSVLPTEIIIGDDGSTNDTKKIIEVFAATSSVPTKHIWQADDGFKLATIRNKSFAAAKSEYIIQIDGDLLLHKHFIKDHLHFAKLGYFVSGSRTLLSQQYTHQLFANNGLKIPSITSNHVTKKYNALRCRALAQAQIALKKSANNYKYVLGANMAFFKKDLIAVNGYNEDITGWGKEDNELAVRLQQAGAKLRLLKNAAVVWHLYHQEAAKNNMAQNEQMLAQTIQNKITFAANGLHKYFTT